MTEWKEGQEAVYVFCPDVSYRTRPRPILVPIVITDILPTQVHARHVNRNRLLKFIPKAKLRPKGYNGPHGEDKTTEAKATR